MKHGITIILLAFGVTGVAVSFADDRVRQAETDQRDRSSGDVEFSEKSLLQDYLRYAARHNAGMEAAFNRWRAALQRIPQAGALPDPRFNYAYFIDEVETRVGPQRQTFGLSQAFPWFGTLGLRKEAATEAAWAAHQQYERSWLELYERVTAAYHEYWYLGQAIGVTREHMRLVRNMESVARTRFKTGAVPHSAVMQAQLELGKLDDRLRTMEALRAPQAAALNAALNRSVSLPLPWPTTLPEGGRTVVDGDAMERLLTHNPDLRRLDHLVAEADADVGVAGRSRYPDIRLGVDYVDTGEALSAGVADSGKDPLAATIAISLPIWQESKRAATREARLRRTAAEAERMEAENRLQAALSLALYHFRDAERKIDLYGDTLVPQAEQAVNVAQQGFETGRTSFIALIDAQRMLLEFQLSHQRARADRGLRLAEVDRLIGQETSNARETE